MTNPDNSWQSKDDEAFHLLRTVITLARNGYPYDRQLDELRVMVKDAPVIRRIVNSWASEIDG